MTRTEVKTVLGEPTDWSVITRRRKIPAVLKFGAIELHFGQKADSGLWLVYTEKPTDGTPLVIAEAKR